MKEDYYFPVITWNGRGMRVTIIHIIITNLLFSTMTINLTFITDRCIFHYLSIVHLLQCHPPLFTIVIKSEIRSLLR
jgi:hypothetical protein